MRQWYNARDSIARTLSTEKRRVVQLGDLRALLNAGLYSKESSSPCWDLNLQDALFWSLLYLFETFFFFLTTLALLKRALSFFAKFGLVFGVRVLRLL